MTLEWQFFFNSQNSTNQKILKTDNLENKFISSSKHIKKMKRQCVEEKLFATSINKLYSEYVNDFYKLIRQVSKKSG